ncbi:DUF3078 domain-containing protein [Mesonia aestuariivivens]|uniref:DUF3078 domain-containing protein n=1 Tax=Mesonia aestuariivivens TaxID=2796128 RepID=A0ABS6W206_9FLAO|nr:DUF3078 domain-containing protein [Mesonia aestuariivivens]MBW2961885.1 DUF3078 domain-containing protein [Mesonia aestuariivivens]
MKKLLLLSLAILCSQVIFAQESEQEDDKPKEGWIGTGTFSLLFNQAAFNAEWQGGGTSNYAGNATISYNLNYNKDNFTWDNTFLGDFGLTKVKDQDFTRKTNDRLELNSVAGWEISDSNWYYSVFANFRTQFAKGYKYSEQDVIDVTTGNVVGTEVVRTETTHFMSPGYLQVGPGMLWKKNDNFKVNIAPATARFIFVDDQFTTLPGYEDGDYFGVDQGESMRFEFGASVSAYAKFDVVENVSFENMINLYSNYLEDPQNVDLDYTGKLNMKVNDYLSANFIFQTVYDDNAVRAFQVREVLGVGFTYKINPQEE